jgi:nucleoside triphosphate pyrophosphatase
VSRLILASRSADRLRLLQSAGHEVESIPADIEEPSLTGSDDLEAGLAHIAVLKARAAWRRGAGGLIFAADTVGLVGGEVFGKPIDREDARRMLLAISGTVHEVLTGWCLFRSRDQLHLSGVEKTTITMRPWTAGEIFAYLDSGAWRGKSGAYALEISDDPFVTAIAGSWSNVVGVPLERLSEVLAGFKW